MIFCKKLTLRRLIPSFKETVFSTFHLQLTLLGEQFTTLFTQTCSPLIASLCVQKCVQNSSNSQTQNYHKYILS